MGLDLGADIDKRHGSRKNTVLHLAVQMQNPDLIQLLVRQPQCPVNVPNKNGETPIMKAVMSGNKVATGFLVDARADLNAQDNVGNSALSHARARGRTEFVEFLLA